MRQIWAAFVLVFGLGRVAQGLAKVFLVQAHPGAGRSGWVGRHLLAVVALHEQKRPLLWPVLYPVDGGVGHVEWQGAGQRHAKAFVEDAAVNAGNGVFENVGAGEPNRGRPICASPDAKRTTTGSLSCAPANDRRMSCVPASMGRRGMSSMVATSSALLSHCTALSMAPVGGV